MAGSDTCVPVSPARYVPGSNMSTGGKAEPGQSSSPTERLFQEICSSFSSRGAL